MSEIPKLEAADMPGIKDLSREQLDRMDHDKWKLMCKAEGCTHYTTLKDYGIWPELFGRFSKPWFNVMR